MSKSPPSSPFLCMDLTYITCLLKDGFGFKDGTELRVRPLHASQRDRREGRSPSMASSFTESLALNSEWKMDAWWKWSIRNIKALQSIKIEILEEKKSKVTCSVQEAYQHPFLGQNHDCVLCFTKAWEESIYYIYNCVVSRNPVTKWLITAGDRDQNFNVSENGHPILERKISTNKLKTWVRKAKSSSTLWLAEFQIGL